MGIKIVHELKHSKFMWSLNPLVLGTVSRLMQMQSAQSSLRKL